VPLELPSPGDGALPPREAAVLAALRDAGGRVLGRGELARLAGLSGLSERRVDAVLAGLRRRLPPGSVVTVRGRGWALRGDRPHETGTGRKHTGLLPETPAP
jgi:DNA-binding response OmpR family regulator